MKKQISLLLVALGLSLSNGAQAGFYGPSKQAIKRATTLLPLCTRADDGRLSQETLHAAKKQFGTKTSSFLPKPGTTMPARTYSELLSKPSTITMPIRTFTPSTLGTFDQEQNRSNYGWWQSIKDSPTAKWIAAFLAGSVFIKTTGSALAEEEAKNPHFEELLKSEYGPTPGMIRANTEHLWKLLGNNEDYMNDVNDRAVQKTINLGANIHDRNDKGETPLLYVTKQRYIWALYHRNEWKTIPEVLIEALIKAGSDVNAQNNEGETALMNAAKKGYQHGVKALLEAKANVNVKDKDGRTALMYAQDISDINVTKSLVENGANVNDKDNYGETPLMLAKNVESAEFLVAKGADVNAKAVNGYTPLLYVPINANNAEEESNLTKFFIAQGADVNAKTNDGWTPLHMAVRSVFGSFDSAKALIDAGADVNAKSDDGRTPLDLAGRWKDMVNLLKAHGATK